MPRRGEIRERRLVGVNVTERKKQLCARSAILREQNALPHEAWTTADPLAKDDVNNVGVGHAAKGAFLDARSSLFRRFAPCNRIYPQ